MKCLKISLIVIVLMAITGKVRAAVAQYDAEAAKTSATEDVANWMSYLPDDMFVAHVSIPGTHDAATAEGWESATGSTFSTTQAKTLDEQLAGGIRAFDFRPGLYNGELWCNHGTDRTKLKLADAFAKLTAYLDAHPGEFFVIHLFRGNVFRSGEASAANKLIGAKDDASSRATYNNLFNELFNKQLDDYIVDYSPYLKVKDIRGKMVIFRRDRIDFAHIAKAGNLADWPGSEEVWDETRMVNVTNASDETIKGIIRATDVSSPDNESELNIEQNSVRDLFAYNCNQTKPNDAKRAGSYKPYWPVIFTSGAYNGENTNGYLKNATYMNPFFTDLIQNSTVKGPTGTVFSDWVLVDEHSGNAVKGVNLVSAIYLNNFDYVADYILDDELFGAANAENYWENGKEYFLQNRETGLFLSSGADWGTHAVLNDAPIRLTLVYDENNNTYALRTTQGASGGLGANYYVDNGTPAEFSAQREGDGYFSFHLDGKAMSAITTGNTYADGTVYLVDGADYVSGNAAQQWKLTGVDEYYAEQCAMASVDNPQDVSYMIRGGRFLPNDADNWTGTTNSKTVAGTTYASYIECNGTNAWNDKNLVLHCRNTKSISLYNSNTVWSFKHTTSGLKAGHYKVVFLAGYNNFNINDNVLTFTLNGEDCKSGLQSVGSDNAADAVTKFRENPALYTITKNLTLGDNGEITFEASKTKTTSVTSFYLDDVKLYYLGPDVTEVCNFLQKVINDTKSVVSEHYSGYDWNWDEVVAPYQAMVDNQSVVGDGTAEAYAIYDSLRSLVNAAESANRNMDVDMTGAIINNSFEIDNGFGWNYEVPSGADVGVKPNSNNTYAVDNCHNDYLFNAWNSDNGGVPVTQIISGLPAGKYTLKLKAVSGDTTDPRYVYLLAGDGHSDPKEINVDKTTMSEVSHDFEVTEPQDVLIGVAGGNADGTYNADGNGKWYKADNFTLVRKADTNESTGISGTDAGPAEVDVYTVTGVMVRKGVARTAAVDNLPAGIYILTDGRRNVKVIK